MKKFFKGLLISLLIVVGLSAVFYVGMAVYYKDGFSYGTFINDVYCTGKSIDEINTQLIARTPKYDGLVIEDGNNRLYTINSDDVFYNIDYKNKLIEIYSKQNPFLWGKNLLNNSRYKVTPTVSYNEEILNEIIASFPFYEKIPENERELFIQKTFWGYQIKNNKEHVLDNEYTKSLIAQRFGEMAKYVNLEAEGAYKNIPYTDKEMKLLKLYEKIDDFQTCDFKFKFGDYEIPVFKSDACEFISFDPNGDFLLDDRGELVLNEDALFTYVDNVFAPFNTYGKTRTFQTSQGRTVTVEGGNYGNEFDVEAEKLYFLEAFKNKSNEVHEPEYLHEALYKGKNDIGDTYIEIDLTNQHMYYYEDGELKVDTDVVTGNTSLHRGTITGTYYVYNHRKDTVLIGANYQSFVRFWLGVYKGYGIHDASWRGSYGGQIYKYDGSHGCINTPYEKVKEMWYMVEEGTPVILFY